VAAATFLKNFLKKQWTEEGGTMSAKERCNFRNQLVEVLLCIDGLVLKQLAEAVCPPLKHLSQELFLYTLLSGLFSVMLRHALLRTLYLYHPTLWFAVASSCNQ
jgi:hypothetical protein